MKIIYFLSLFLFVWAYNTNAQWIDVPSENEEIITSLPNNDSSSISKITWKGLFWIYRKGISQHDGSICPFHPSCSQYAQQAIQQYGIWQGMLMAADRLERCNGCIVGKYIYSVQINRFLDPPDDHDVLHYDIPAMQRIPLNK